MGTTVQDVRAGSGYVGGVRVAQAEARVAPRPSDASNCDRVDYSANLRGLVGAQTCTKALALLPPGTGPGLDRGAAMYGRELHVLDRLIDQASRGDEDAHRAVVAAFESHLAGSRPLDAREARRFDDYRSRLETYVRESMWRGNHRYFAGQNAEHAFNAAVASVLADREPNAAILGTANTLDWLANAPRNLLESFGTNPGLVPWLAALQASPQHNTPAVRGAWDNLQSQVARSRPFRSTYTAVLEAMPQGQRAAFSAGVISQLERSAREASLPSARQFNAGEVAAYRADLGARIAFVRANP